MASYHNNHFDTHPNNQQQCAHYTMSAATTTDTSIRSSDMRSSKRMSTIYKHNVALTPAIVLWYQRHVLKLAPVMLMVFLSIDNTSFGYAWTTSTAKNSCRRPCSIMKEFRPSISVLSSRRSTPTLKITSSTETNGSDVDSSTLSQQQQQQRPLCFYRDPVNSRWKQRIDIQNLTIGQELQGAIVQEKLTNTTTGPKIWLDVGVCRWSSKGTPYRKNTTNSTTSVSSPTQTEEAVSITGGWKICTALLRLGMNSYVKESVLRKKMTRLKNKATITVYVSRLFLHEGRFDVVLTPDDVPTTLTTSATPLLPLQSVAALHVGDEITGTVTKVVDYGAMVRLDGYNRGGLLHIKQVAELYNTYIDKKQGLIDAGLSPKSRVRLQVIEKDKKRIFLDFTNDVKEIAREEQRREQEEVERQQNELRAQLQQRRETASAKITLVESPMTDAAAIDTGAVVVVPIEPDVSGSLGDANDIDVEGEDDDDEEEEEADDEEYDNYDEERDIEDALGLGMY